MDKQATPKLEKDRVERGAWLLVAHPYTIKTFCPDALWIDAETGNVNINPSEIIEEMFTGQDDLIAFTKQHQRGYYIVSDYRVGGGDPADYTVKLDNVLHIIRERMPKEISSLPWFNDAKAVITPDSVTKPDLGQTKFAYFFIIRIIPAS